MPTKSTSSTNQQVNTTSLVPIGSLRMYQRNPRKGNVGVVAASLVAHGQYRPIVVNIGTHTGRANEVLAGNHTLKAFRALAQKHPDDERWSTILVHWVDVDDDQAARIVLADNKTSEAGGYDNDALAGLLGEVKDSLDGLGATGFTFEDLDALTHEDGVDLSDLSDDQSPPPDSGGRGNPVIAYSIVFDDQKQRAVWLDFIGWLKRTHPDLTAAERLMAYLEELAMRRGEAETRGE